MIEEILSRITSLTPFWLYFALFAFAYIENIFPPSPSDLVVVVGGSLIAAGAIEFIPTLVLTSLGSVLGFMTLYYLGKQLDKKVIRSGRFKFISIEALDKAEKWFLKYGYFVILANRFMPGTRSVISFFAGMSNLNIKKTVVLASISAIAWNILILYLGIFFGKNIEIVDYYLSTYNRVFIIITVAIVLFFVVRYFIQKKKKKKKN
jgi:membrane protein DedA with SNARE-associated domain